MVSVTSSSAFTLRKVFSTALFSATNLVRLYDDRLGVFQGSTHLFDLPRGRPGPNGKHGHVVDYRHVIHSLRRKPMALLNLVDRDELFPQTRIRQSLRRAACPRLEKKRACKTMVALLALAHERACEAELAIVIEEELDSGRLPDSAALTERFAPKTQAAPIVVIALPELAVYD